MSCSIEKKVDRLNVSLTFSREQLLYDIKNYAYVESHVMSPDTEHARHMVADVGEEGNVDRVTRVLDLGVAKCREMLYPWAKMSISNTEFNDTLQEQAQYRIDMTVPTTMSETTLSFVERYIHEFLVCRGVSDWLSITNPQKSEVWMEKANEAEREIGRSIHSRVERTRIRQHWFK
jgi:hypothetical protein